MTNVPAKPTPAKEPQRRPLAPGVATWTIVALCLALVVILHATEILTDIAVVQAPVSKGSVGLTVWRNSSVTASPAM